MKRTDGRWDLRSRPMVNAECEDCGTRWYSANAQGVAAIHSRRYSHAVQVEVSILYRYGSPEPPRDGPGA